MYVQCMRIYRTVQQVCYLKSESTTVQFETGNDIKLCRCTFSDIYGDWTSEIQLKQRVHQQKRSDCHYWVSLLAYGSSVLVLIINYSMF